MNWGERPVILLGAGARGADMSAVLALGVPILTSWPAKDLIDNRHALYFGSPGVYGQRLANKVLYEADTVIAIGNRLSVWNVGHAGLREDQRLVQVELDQMELRRGAEHIWQDAEAFVESLRGERVECVHWLIECAEFAEQYRLVESAHADSHFINSYRFTEALEPMLRADEVIVTEMGAALCSAHQVLSLRPPQRLMTSGGLGEMGCALPAAIGASFARGHGPVLCLSTDGGMMLNLQELQTIAHYQLPVRIIVYNNSGYGMLKETQANAGMRYSGVNERTGVSFPNFRHVALAFGITASEVATWEDFKRIMPSFMQSNGPALVDYVMDPGQPLIPRLSYRTEGGEKVYDRFDQMRPHG